MFILLLKGDFPTTPYISLSLSVQFSLASKNKKTKDKSHRPSGPSEPSVGNSETAASHTEHFPFRHGSLTTTTIVCVCLCVTDDSLLRLHSSALGCSDTSKFSFDRQPHVPPQDTTAQQQGWAHQASILSSRKKNPTWLETPTAIPPQVSNATFLLFFCSIFHVFLSLFFFFFFCNQPSFPTLLVPRPVTFLSQP